MADLEAISAETSIALTEKSSENGALLDLDDPESISQLPAASGDTKNAEISPDQALLQELDLLTTPEPSEIAPNSNEPLNSEFQDVLLLSPAVEDNSARTADLADVLAIANGETLPESEHNRLLAAAPSAEVAQNGMVSPAASVSSFGSQSESCGPAANARLDKIARLYERYSQQCVELERLEKQNSEYRDQLLSHLRERDATAIKTREASDSFTAKIQELERKLLEYDYQLKATKDRLAAQEAHLKRSTADAQTKFAAQIEQLRSSTETAQREKNDAVIKFARREAEILGLQKSRDKLGEQLKQTITERDALASQLRSSKNEKLTVLTALDDKEGSLSDIRRELDRSKAVVQEADVRVKLANKRAEEAESEAKEAKTALEPLQQRLKDTKEENEAIRADHQRLLAQIQDSDSQRNAEMEIQKREHSDQSEVYKMVQTELDALKKQHRESLREVQETQARMSAAAERSNDAEKRAQELEWGRQADKKELERLRVIATTVERANSESTEARRAEEVARADAKQSELEAAECRQQAERLLELTQQLSEKNSQLSAERAAFETRTSELEARLSEVSEQNRLTTARLGELESSHSSLLSGSDAEITSLREQLQLKVKRDQDLSAELADEKDSIRVLKKKHNASLKELRAELSLLRRRASAYESGAASLSGEQADATGALMGQGGGLSMSSRASSVTSLEQASASLSAATNAGGGGTTTTTGSASPTSLRAPAAIAVDGSRSSRDTDVNDSPTATCVHNQTMVEKIVKLQKAVARRSEKVDFLEEHIRQLVDELQKKTRLIQMFALREESGALAPQSVDLNKLLEYCDQEAELARRGNTLMGSVFRQRTSDQKASADLMLEINGKLQAVLEDALLKNIALKESVDTLGQEISRLSREHREMELSRKT